MIDEETLLGVAVYWLQSLEQLIITSILHHLLAKFYAASSLNTASARQHTYWSGRSTYFVMYGVLAFKHCVCVCITHL